MTPQRLFELAGPELRSLIESRQGDRSQVRELDVIEATHDLLPYLGINYSAWSEAARLMGDVGTSLCVLILDANRNHPTAPVRNAGGALRGMIKRHEIGKPNLIGSLIGLSRRCGL